MQVLWCSNTFVHILYIRLESSSMSQNNMRPKTRPTKFVAELSEFRAPCMKRFNGCYSLTKKNSENCCLFVQSITGEWNGAILSRHI